MPNRRESENCIFFGQSMRRQKVVAERAPNWPNSAAGQKVTKQLQFCNRLQAAKTLGPAAKGYKLQLFKQSI